METKRIREKTSQKSLKVLIIVQARMGATRLPGKPMKLVKGRTLLSYLIERLKEVKNAQDLVIATTVEPRDDVLEAASKKSGVLVFRGSEEDVLKRYFEAAKQYGADVVVRITADCPLMDPEVVDRCISHFVEHSGELDYLSNTLELTFPRGMDTEVFSFQALKKAHDEAKEKDEREHVTLYMYRHPEKFRLKNIRSPENLAEYRWTVDTPEDFQLISKILEALIPTKPNFHLQDIVDLLRQHPDWSKINAHIRQKVIKGP